MFEKQIKLPQAAEVIAKFPLSDKLKEIKQQRDKEISAVLKGESSKILVIVGPCSAHAEKPVLEYVGKLGKLSAEVEDKLILIPRIYTVKPRSKGVGYMGMFTKPYPEREEDVLHGIYMMRDMDIKAIEISGLTPADEMLYPNDYEYTQDIVSYVAVGARSSEDQLHRLVASGVESALGFKNPLSGSFSAMLNSIFAAQNPQTFKLNGWQVKTGGNPLAHAILRGRVDEKGRDIPNCSYDDVISLIEAYYGGNLKNPSIIIDVNHSNSGKDFEKQKENCQRILADRHRSNDYKKTFKGFMIESFLEEGCQREDIVYGKSITDPCLGWEDTRKLILDIASKI